MIKFLSSKQALAALLTVAAVCTVQAAFAQAGGGPIQPAAVPVDGGVSLLALVGGAFAFRSLRRK